MTKDELARLGEVSMRLDSLATYVAQSLLGEAPLEAAPVLNLVEATRLQLRKATEQ